MIILDTDFLIDLAKNRKEAINKLEEIAGQTLAITSISIMELAYGALKKDGVFEEKNFLQYFILPFKKNEAVVAAKIRLELEHNGRIEVEDEMIAATAMVHNAVLLTRNTRHFKRIKGLKTDTW